MDGCGKVTTSNMQEIQALYHRAGFADKDGDGVIEKKSRHTWWRDEGYQPEVDLNHDDKIDSAEAKYYLLRQRSYGSRVEDVANSNRATSSALSVTSSQINTPPITFSGEEKQRVAVYLRERVEDIWAQGGRDRDRAFSQIAWDFVDIDFLDGIVYPIQKMTTTQMKVAAVLKIGKTIGHARMASVETLQELYRLAVEVKKRQKHLATAKRGVLQFMSNGDYRMAFKAIKLNIDDRSMQVELFEQVALKVVTVMLEPDAAQQVINAKTNARRARMLNRKEGILALVAQAFEDADSLDRMEDVLLQQQALMYVRHGAVDVAKQKAASIQSSVIRAATHFEIALQSAAVGAVPTSR